MGGRFEVLESICGFSFLFGQTHTRTNLRRMDRRPGDQGRVCVWLILSALPRDGRLSRSAMFILGRQSPSLLPPPPRRLIPDLNSTASRDFPTPCYRGRLIELA